ncbi:uncharacterized protein MYCFIDRAFT_171645 [Pseudocercospora fijiensis CIRAD86]|uniref:Uncharacterized protein n=1 Tax=Pseudocercospora fijiensis (strain CIRAD86) TaxID=383855 RepID=M3AMH7_PSEFD|nr:uncharacterized protein MYCFIDRAFT_171645 [Pseudocercospora fijiensis CIRAD86]EME85766.1 hypothetical protein MYCFIDRAFT_171645 [Pseudocercospora fijiensis CIRAD86]
MHATRLRRAILRGSLFTTSIQRSKSSGWQAGPQSIKSPIIVQHGLEAACTYEGAQLRKTLVAAPVPKAHSLAVWLQHQVGSHVFGKRGTQGTHAAVSCSFIVDSAPNADAFKACFRRSGAYCYERLIQVIHDHQAVASSSPVDLKVLAYAWLSAVSTSAGLGVLAWRPVFSSEAKLYDGGEQSRLMSRDDADADGSPNSILQSIFYTLEYRSNSLQLQNFVNQCTLQHANDLGNSRRHSRTCAAQSRERKRLREELEAP